jgi:hypothetical protein
MHRRGHVQALTLSSAGAPPGEFLIWRAGRNPTRNGYAVLFDADAASAVMAAYAEHGTEIMLDLEHMSLDDRHPNWKPDAVGWCKLELRGGELWAVSVRWTPDGTRRLTEQTQRYTSPTFYSSDVEGEAALKRPTQLLNVALCAMPATDHLPALVASQKQTRSRMDSKKLGAALRVLRRRVTAQEHLRLLSEEFGEAEAAPGKSFMELAEFLGVAIDPGMDPVGFIQALKEGVAQMMAGLEASPAAPPAEEPAEMADKPEEEPETMQALRRLTGAKDAVDVVVKVADWRKLALEHEADQRKLAAERAALDATKRRALTARLVVCGSETPATAWADDAKTVPAEHLQALSLEKLEARVASFEARSGVRSVAQPARTASAAGAELSDRELQICRETGVDPAVYAKNKATREAARTR